MGSGLWLSLVLLRFYTIITLLSGVSFTEIAIRLHSDVAVYVNIVSKYELKPLHLTVSHYIVFVAFCICFAKELI